MEDKMKNEDEKSKIIKRPPRIKKEKPVKILKTGEVSKETPVHMRVKKMYYENAEYRERKKRLMREYMAKRKLTGKTNEYMTGVRFQTKEWKSLCNILIY